MSKRDIAVIADACRQLGRIFRKRDFWHGHIEYVLNEWMDNWQTGLFVFLVTVLYIGAAVFSDDSAGALARLLAVGAVTFTVYMVVFSAITGQACLKIGMIIVSTIGAAQLWAMVSLPIYGGIAILLFILSAVIRGIDQLQPYKETEQ